jgi:hypothetical protein
VIIALAQRYRMPDVHALAEAVAVGGLVSYGINWSDQFRTRLRWAPSPLMRSRTPCDVERTLEDR